MNKLNKLKKGRNKNLGYADNNTQLNGKKRNNKRGRERGQNGKEKS